MSMSKDNTWSWFLSSPLGLGLGMVVLLALSWGCSSQSAKTREIRAHTRMIGGVAHAEPALRAERYCSHCHGQGLAGGEKTGVPSCFTCHGKNWIDGKVGDSTAPVDHTVVNGIYAHHP